MQTDNKNYRLWQATGQGMAFSVLTVVLLLSAGVAHAQMYRWVDGNGRVHYSDTPPTTYRTSGGGPRDGMPERGGRLTSFDPFRTAPPPRGFGEGSVEA